MTATIIGAAAASIWLYLIAFHGRFWWVRQQAVAVAAAPRRSIVAVIPARDEAAVIGRAVASLMAQRYPGPFHVVVVDDQSSDGTAEAARAAVTGGPDRLTVAAGQPVMTLEAMKMEHVHTAGVAGTVSAIDVAEGEQVTTGRIVIEIEAAA